MSASSCWSVLSSDSWKQQLPAGVRPRLTGLCTRGSPECKGVACVPREPPDTNGADWQRNAALGTVRSALTTTSRSFFSFGDNLHLPSATFMSSIAQLVFLNRTAGKASFIADFIPLSWGERNDFLLNYRLLINDPVGVNNWGKLEDGRILYPSRRRLMNELMHHCVKLSIQGFVN